MDDQSSDANEVEADEAVVPNPAGNTQTQVGESTDSDHGFEVIDDESEGDGTNSDNGFEVLEDVCESEDDPSDYGVEVAEDELEEEETVSNPSDCIQIGLSQDRTNNQISLPTRLGVSLLLMRLPRIIGILGRTSFFHFSPIMLSLISERNRFRATDSSNQRGSAINLLESVVRAPYRMRIRSQRGTTNAPLIHRQSPLHLQAAISISYTTNFSQWEKKERIGGGGFGIVYVAVNRETGQRCAVKEIYDPEIAESLNQEIEVLRQLQHPNIVGNRISLYMEYVHPGSMKKYILARGALQEPLVRNFTLQILSGLVYLHSRRVVHRDIKADNLLLFDRVDSDHIVKLADFGLAKHLQVSVGSHSKTGTPYWTAPEVFEKQEYNSSGQAFAADIWSLGCTIIEMFTGEHPWRGFEPVQAIYRVCHQKQNPSIPEKLSPEGKDFLALCFTRNPAERPSAEALLEHAFVKHVDTDGE